MQPVTVIVNPVAAKGRAKRTAQQLEQCLQARNVEYIRKDTQYCGHATELARECAQNGVEMLLALGGDGTVMEVAKGIIGSPTAMGIIPGGTGNDFSRTLGVPRGCEAALDYFLNADIRQVDIGKADEELFLNVSGTGFDVDVLLNTERFKRVLTGMPAYYLGVVMAIFGRKIRRVTLTTDEGETQKDVLLIAVANGKYYAGGMAVAPDADCTDGLFDVCVINRINKLRLLLILPLFVKGAHHKIREIEHFNCRKISVATPDSIPLNLDGEIMGATPVTYTLLHNALSFKA